MSPAPSHPRDPLAWHGGIALLFLALVSIRLTIPSYPYFDEIHYVPAARVLLALSEPVNQEHPLLGKELIALGMTLFGDNALGWRLMSALFGGLGLFAAMRAMWFTSCSRFASVATGILIATAFPLFVQSRIAMLDVFMVSLTLVALWALAGAVRENETGRRRLAIAGIAFGLAMAAKWNAVPLAMLAGIAFAVIRFRESGWRFITATRAAPVAGVALWEAALWLGVVPLAVYWLTYIPAMFYAHDPLPPTGLLGLTGEMIHLQNEVLKPHPYQSVWYEWIFDIRPIWYFYEPADGAERGVLMVGNPLTMLIGLGALVWAGVYGFTEGRRDALALFVLYVVALGTWIVSPKPIQFYYHYILPSCFLMGALALALAEMWNRGRRLLPLLVLAASAALFAWFWPLLDAAPLADTQAFNHWMWLDSWR
jgi:dolichyl-phosphate-mannose--protein O-mannosyl transferase